MDVKDIKPIMVHRQYRPSGSHMKIEQFFDPLQESMQRIRSAEKGDSEEQQDQRNLPVKRIDILA